MRGEGVPRPADADDDEDDVLGETGSGVGVTASSPGAGGSARPPPRAALPLARLPSVTPAEARSVALKEGGRESPRPASSPLAGEGVELVSRVRVVAALVAEAGPLVRETGCEGVGGGLAETIPRRRLRRRDGRPPETGVPPRLGGRVRPADVAASALAAVRPAPPPPEAPLAAEVAARRP